MTRAFQHAAFAAEHKKLDWAHVNAEVRHRLAHGLLSGMLHQGVPTFACHALQCGLHVCMPDSVISALHTYTCQMASTRDIILPNKGHHSAHMMMQNPV